MKNTFWYHFLLLIVLLLCIENLHAIPAPPIIRAIKQPDGSILNVWIKGDEFFHYTQSTDGYILMPDKNGFYTYAVPDSTGTLCAGKIIAVNENERTETDRLYLKNIKPGLDFSNSLRSEALNRRIKNALRHLARLKSANAIKPGLTDVFPTTGSPKSLVILVNFSDLSFNSRNKATDFSSMLNEEGYHANGHVGSSRDYFRYNSGNSFSPDFVVVGPVTLTKTMSYYGQNDSNGDDMHPEEMVYDACVEAAKYVNFSDFDYDNNGVVDNVFVFYAGGNEAEGSGANTIWPHKYALSYANLNLNLNGKKIDTYACSSELDGSGKRSGIGAFTHEYSHVLGLPDMYDVDYGYYNGQGYDLGEWSLMAMGSYNGDGCVPPSFSILERKLLGWANPTLLNKAAALTLSDLGSTNQGYMIPTNNPGEYFLLENRQQSSNPWDAFLPYHGMLIYHIDMKTDASTSVNIWGDQSLVSYADLWSINMVNAIATHQCADIQEADDLRNITVSNTTQYYNNLKGDPFPGLTNASSFTFDTKPSMRTWDNLNLDKPITSISEKEGILSFNYMGGVFNTPPMVMPATKTGNYKFTANWKSTNKAVGYYLDVYTIKITTNGDTLKTYIPGYDNFAVADTFCTVNELDDYTTYYYNVRATNSYIQTDNSLIVKVTTTKASSITPYVKDKTVNVKGIDHGSVIKVYNTNGILCLTTTDNKFAIDQRGLYFIEAFFDGKKQILKVLVN